MLELLKIEFGYLEGLRRRQERDTRPLLAACGSDDLQRSNGIAMRELHIMFFIVAPDCQVESQRKRIDHRDTYTVKAAGNLVGIVIRRVFEFPAGVELGHDHFGRRNTLFGMDTGRNAPAIIFHRNRAVWIERDRDPVAMACQCFIDRVVGNFENHMVQAGTVVGIADIHAGPFANRIKAFEDLDRIGTICGSIGGILGFVCHAQPIGKHGRKPKGNATHRTI